MERGSRLDALVASIQRYELLDRIGMGALSELHRAYAWPDDGGKPALVVVKRIRHEQAQDPEVVEMFLDEMRVVALLDHPNIVKMLDVGHLDGDWFLSLEHVKGCDLESLLVSRAEGMPLSTNVSLYVLRELLKGLHYAHQATGPGGLLLKVVHRDLEPSNVLLSTSGEVKLTDFGVAKSTVRSSGTAVGTVKGNHLYMAPEQIERRPLDARTDVFGAGMLLHRLLSGRHPLGKERTSALLTRIVKGDIPPPSSMNRSLPEEIDDLVMRAIRPNPDDRYPTADAFRAALDSTSGVLGLTLEPGPLIVAVRTVLEEPGRAATRIQPSIVERIGPLISMEIEKKTDPGERMFTITKTDTKKIPGE